MDSKIIRRRLLRTAGSLVLVAGAAVLALPHLPARRASASACGNNLRQLDGAKATWAMEKGLSGTATPRTEDLCGEGLYLRAEPVCPLGGTYVLGSVGQPTRCTLCFPRGNPVSARERGH